MGKPHEFDRALPAPVPWTQPVLRAVFACPCSTHLVAAGFRLRPVKRVERTSRFHRQNLFVISLSLYLAPLSAQSHRWLCSNGEPREQAHLPAEQPSTGQDPRLPPAHAHPRRPRHPGLSSPQGSLRTVRLRLDACCQRVIVCEAAPISPKFSGGHAGQVDLVRAAASSWCMPTRPTHVRVNRRGSVLSSPRPSVTQWSATGPSGFCGLS